MKLDPDYIRVVMLEIEKSHSYYVNDDGFVTTDPLTLASIQEALPDIRQEDIYYTLFNLSQAGYIDLTTKWASGCVYICHVNYMTVSGHEFLNKIRDTKQWSAVKGGLNAVRNYSLDAINAIASGITTAAITTYLAELK